MVMRRILLCVAIACAASPTWACGVLDHADPKVGSNVTGALSSITLTFSEAIVPSKSSVELDDPNGKPVESNPFTMSSESVMKLTSLQPLAPGPYKVHWRVEWKDCGSITDGHYDFMLAP